MEFIELLKGKKTYILVGVVIVLVICESILGIDIPGVEITNPLDYILAALGLGTLRAGVSKVNNV